MSDPAEFDDISDGEDKFGSKVNFTCINTKENSRCAAGDKILWSFELTFFKFKKMNPGMYTVINQQKRKSFW